MWPIFYSGTTHVHNLSIQLPLCCSTESNVSLHPEDMPAGISDEDDVGDGEGDDEDGDDEYGYGEVGDDTASVTTVNNGGRCVLPTQ